MMTWNFARSHVRIAVSVLGLLGAPFVGTAVAQVNVPGNFGTIQAAINAVMSGSLPDGTTINVQPGTYFEVLSVANTGRSMTVRGVGGAGATVVDAGGRNAPVLNVLRATGQVVFRGLTFRNAVTSIEGGGFLIRESSPALVDCIFESNSAYRGGAGALFASHATFTGCILRNNSAQHFGGGVYMVNGSRPTFTASDIVGNASGTGGAGVGNNGAGGGVFSHDSSPTFRGGRISGNSSKFAAGGLFHAGVFGSPYGRSMLVMEDAELADNVSVQFPGEPNPAEGGGMHLEDNATATLTRVRVLRNRAGTGGGLNMYRGRYEIFDSVIDANQASVGFGGGIAASANYATAQMPASVLTLTATLVRNNTAPLGAGITMVGDNFSSERASLSLTASVVSGNQSQSQGGGILVNRTILTAANSLIINNRVASGAVPYGGGLLITTTSTATINTTTIAHNTAGELGGGLFVSDNSVIYMTGSQVYHNTAGARGGGLFVAAGQSGTIQNNIIADNIGTQVNSQINEDACSSVAYPNNLITSPAFTGCSTLASRAPGTDSTSKPRFAKFMAVPGAGTTLTLAWSVARATSVTIAGVGTWNSPNNSPTGTVDVTPVSSTTYSLTAAATQTNGGNYGPVTAGFVVVRPPSAVRRSVAGDFDGDGKADFTVYRPSNTTWYVLRSGTGFTSAISYVWGALTDVPAPGDYDGDGRTDVVVYRPASGVWYTRMSSTNYAVWGAYQWGGDPTDVPVAGDYDGDGKTDFAVYRRSNTTWYVLRSGTGFTSAFSYVWGASTDVPAPGDYDGDGRTDVVVYRPASGTWYTRLSSANYTVWGAYQWGGDASDVPVAGDYDGDARTDFAVYRRSNTTWYILRSRTGFTGASSYVWGASTDIPVPADYDGDGSADIVVYRPSSGIWYTRLSTTNYVWGSYQWGTSGDIPVLKPR